MSGGFDWQLKGLAQIVNGGGYEASTHDAAGLEISKLFHEGFYLKSLICGMQDVSRNNQRQEDLTLLAEHFAGLLLQVAILKKTVWAFDRDRELGPLTKEMADAYIRLYRPILEEGVVYGNA